MSKETNAATPEMQAVATEPYRLGIILVGEELQSPALKLFILAMNRIQCHFEYELLPQGIPDVLLTDLKKEGTKIDRQATRAQARDFPDRFNIALAQMIDDYGVADARPPNYLVVVSMASFSDNYFSMRQPRISVLALGNWKDSMAPPSIIEFIQTLIVREAIASVCPQLRGSMHLGSRGCICDFNWSLDEARLKVLNGFLCSYCRRELQSAGHAALANEVEHVLARGWIGDLTTTTSVASTIAKLGVNLFVTKGLVPTWHEHVLNILREDGVKELLKFIYAIVLAGLLVYFGWRT